MKICYFKEEKKNALGVPPVVYLFAESKRIFSILISVSNYLNTVEKLFNSTELNLFYNEYHLFIIGFAYLSVLFLVLFIFYILDPLGISR